MADLSKVNDLVFQKETEEVLNFFKEPKKSVAPDVLDNIIKNSVPENGRKRRVIANWKTGLKSAAIISMVVAIIISVVTMAVNKISDKVTLEELIDNSQMAKIVQEAENVYRIPGESEYKVDHDTHDIANHLINKSKDFHEDLFITAYEVSKEYDDATEEKVMDDIIERASIINNKNNPNNVMDYESWRDYCKTHGFVDSKGEADLGKYMTQMADHLVSEENNNNFEEDHGLGGSR